MANAPADTDRLIVAVRGLLGIMVPLGAVAVAVFATKASLEADIRENRDRMSHNREITDAAMDRLRLDLDNLRGELRGHTRMGNDGVDHPTSSNVRIQRLEEKIDTLQKRLKQE